MSKVATAEFRDALAHALDIYLQDPSSIGLTSDLAILARAHNALPVYADMGGALLIRPSGEVLLVHSNQGWTATSECSVVTESQWIAVAYAACENRYPRLRGLLPLAAKKSGFWSLRRIPIGLDMLKKRASKNT
jgi:hypothetical protein